MEEDKVHTGVVCWFDKAKGFGFVKPDESDKDLFIHYSNIVGEGFKTLEANQKVSFKVGANNIGPQAIEIKVL